MRSVIVGASAILLVGCGGDPPQPGIYTNRVAYAASVVGAAPVDPPDRGLTNDWSFRLVRHGDVLGDDEPERLVQLGNGTGIDVQAHDGTSLRQLPAAGTVTDFSPVIRPGRDKADVVVYVYPNEQGGGTFLLIDATGREHARWQELPPPGRFTVAPWHGRPAVFYLQRDRLIVRSPEGERLATLPAPRGAAFSRLFVAPLRDGRTAITASGNGSTPYHLVAVYGPDGELLFESINDEHAFALEPSPEGASFIVTTRTQQVRYGH